jgi:hypothetical protein
MRPQPELLSILDARRLLDQHKLARRIAAERGRQDASRGPGAYDDDIRRRKP